MTREEFSELAQTIPHSPGCYKYYSIENELLYVGKAKDLRKRVSSYFNKTLDNNKTRRLVSLINSLDFTVTETEHDAFLLENSLIKHFQPRFNIALKDDKTYPYVVIRNEPFPRVFLTRRLIRDGSEYIGPFTGVLQVKELLEMVKQSVPLRTCNLNLAQANIARGKYKVCLEYHLGNCKGPCEGYQSADEYYADLQQVRQILKGNISEVLKHLKQQMQDHATRLEFEEAHIIKQKIDSLQNYNSRSTVVNPRLNDLDVISILNDEKNFYVNYMMVIKGSIIHVKTVVVEKILDETERDVLSIVLDRMRNTFHSKAKEVISAIDIDVADEGMKVTLPKMGDKKNLLDMSTRNAFIFKEDIRRRNSLMLQEKTNEEYMAVLEELQDSLQLRELPVHIECFDNSNFQGAYPVAAMVCFRNGQPSNKDYRHFHIKTVEGINDFASMSEVVYRRYKRLTDEKKPLPQLVIIDGGKGQLGAALESIEKLGLMGRMTLVGLAKREESIFFPGDTDPIQLPFDSPAHLLVRRIRDEVHRFGITFHRQTRSKGTFKNELEAIPGIGAQTATELLKEFRSVKNIRSITERELTRVIGASKARLVRDYFGKQDATPTDDNNTDQ
jgi:excinuclease ABC subunit C